MRVALVSPYSCAYPGGVARHVEALADELVELGHEARVLAPHDPDDRLTRFLHGGVRPTRSSPPGHVVGLGRTVALRANGARSNLALGPASLARLSSELRRGRYDLVHVHEPNAPLVSWCATELARVPLVGTFHAHSTSLPVNGFAANVLGARRLYNRLSARVAVSEAARWTAQRFYGGQYRIVPNGVDLAAARDTGGERRQRGAPLELLYLGREEERKGLSVLLRAFEALRGDGVRARLTIAGARAAELRPLILDEDAVTLVGPVSEAEKWRLLAEADVLCAPSLGGESFGMVLVEALACSTPVVCSSIAGYRELVRDEVEGLVVPPGHADALAQALAGLAAEPVRLTSMGRAARARAERFAWPRVASEVVAAYHDALATPAPDDRLGRAAVRLGLRRADGLGAPAAQVDPPAPAPLPAPAPQPDLPAAPQRDPRTPAPPPHTRPGEHAPGDPTERVHRGASGGAHRRSLERWHPRTAIRGPSPVQLARRPLPALLGLAIAAALAIAALVGVGADRLTAAILGAAPLGVLTAVVPMVVALLLRAEAWNAIIRASLPHAAPVRRADTARATMIGVLMSATLPARLGELSRCLVMARRLGRVRERLPLVVGTVASQTLLNLLALAVLGGYVLATVALFRGGAVALALATVVPAAAVLVLAATPALARAAADLPGRSSLRRLAAALARALAGLRSGFAVFARPRLASWAALAQLSAWGLQWLACYLLLVALGLEDAAGLGAAAAILFAVNAAGALPVVPANLGVFQAACVAVLSAYGVDPAEALAYGVVLQGLELATAVALGAPALLGEGLSWRQMRRRALGAAPLDLRPSAGVSADATA